MIFILTALHDQKLFVLQEHHTRDELIRMRLASNNFHCPVCRAPVVLKIGTVNIPHFAHLQKHSCSAGNEPETKVHLLGKSRLSSFFHQQKISSQLEQYLPSIKQRPDLLLPRHAVEFQCSALSAEDVQRRSAGYRSLQLEPLWIRGAEKMPMKGPSIFRIRWFEREMFLGPPERPYLLFFHPEQSLFIYYSNLLYVHANCWVGKASFLPAEQQVFPFAVPRPISRIEYEKAAALFKVERKRFIRSQLFAKNRMTNDFWRLSYELGLSKQALPNIFGIPLPGGHWIKEHPLIWQMKTAWALEKGWELEMLIETNKLGPFFSGKERVLELLSLYKDIYTAGMERSSSEIDEVCYRLLAKAWEN